MSDFKMFLDNIFFFHKDEAVSMLSNETFLLIASPKMNDFYFEKSVIYIYDHSEEGTEGVILNKKSYGSLQDFNPFFENDIPIYNGGPIFMDVPILIHQDSDGFESDEVEENVYVTEEIDNVNFLDLIYNKVNFKLFMGVAQWEKGQLEKELADNNWFILKSDSLFLFKNDKQEDYWMNVLSRLGSHYQFLKHYPKKSYLN